MTVRELRRLLFDIENQDANVEIVTSVRHGHIKTTARISGCHQTPKGVKDEKPEDLVLLSISY